MKITKERVESAVKLMDELVKDVLNEVGLFDYSGTSLVQDWSRVRECVANKAVKVINGTAAKDKKITIRDWSFNNSGSIVSDPVVDEKKMGKTIELEKSKATKFVMMVNKE